MQVGLASPDTIRSWSHGEVTKPETINYRSQKPEPGGLFCEKIFGPIKDYECHCGKYKKIRYQGIVCEKCGVEVISKEWRRERFGHIELVSPCSHIWYLKGTPSRMGLVLDMTAKNLEAIIYFAAHVVLNPGTSKVLKYKMFLDERTARDVFSRAIIDFKDEIPEGSADAEKGRDLIDKMSKETEAFDFFTVSAFIHKYTGAEFGEGAAAIKRLLHEVDLDKEFEEVSAELKTASDQLRPKLAKRLEAIEAFRKSGQKPEWMVLDVIPVIPPDLRPMLLLDGGRFAASDLNDLYRRVISRNNRLKKLIDMSAPYVILMNERRMLQEAVDALIDNGRRGKAVTGPSGRPLKSLSSGLKGKQGRFRQNLLGKRVDYSGRSVIAVGPDLKMYQCGLPREMAIQLLRPFIAALLIKRGYVTAHKQADKIIDRYDSVVFDIVEEIIGQHPVLLNRAPTLHRLGIQAFQPKLVDGHAIRLHPLVCPGFNADFDGDQMAVHVPLGKAAQEEALTLMLASNNILGPKDGKPIVIPSQDMIIGNYFLTTEESAQDYLDRAKDLRAVKIQDDAEKKVADEQAKQFEEFASREGAVFSSVAEVIDAYESKTIGLHNRIAIRATSIHKTIAPENDPDNIREYSLPYSVKDSYLLTSVGKIIFNEIFPDDFYFVNDATKNGLEEIKSWFVPMGTDIKAALKERPLLKAIDKKALGKLIDQVFHKYDMSREADAIGTPSKTSAILDKIKDQGFEYSTVSAVTVAMSDINLVKGKEAEVEKGYQKVDKISDLYNKGFMTDAERHKAVVKVWHNEDVKNPGVTERVVKLVQAELDKEKRNPLVIMMHSGARGSIDNFKQLIGMKGLVANPKNEEIELPVVSSYREGLKVSEFFINTHGARKGGADTALKTADSGYLTRRLVDVAQDVVVREEDCHCDHGFKVREIRDTARDKVIVELRDRLAGRFAMHDIVNPKTGEVIVKGNTMISDEDASAIVEAGIKEVEIRSIFTCQTKDGVCQHCYGRNMATGRLVQVGDAVGIMAAQSIGEPGTQLTMRVFHTGGMAGSDITQGLPRVQELVEARNPKGVAVISEIDGTVVSIEDEKPEEGSKRGKSKASEVEKPRNVIITVRSSAPSTNEKPGVPEEKTYVVGSWLRRRVKVGDHVEAGSKITEGAVDPKHLLEVADVEKVEVYMIKEIQKVYAAQGIGISDKHLEIIIRQMLRKVSVIDGGDTSLLPGTKVDIFRFTKVNQEALLAGKRPAIGRPIILPITKAALQTESFLSAASFQETTRVLTDAAIKAKRDDLHGLKENVITGKLIPAGTGLRTEEEEKEALAKFSVQSKMKEVRATYIEAHDRPLEDEEPSEEPDGTAAETPEEAAEQSPLGE
jgi:DNA-directed RNA polymerase subunit beta'